MNQTSGLVNLQIISCRDQNGVLNVAQCATYLQPSLLGQVCSHLIKSLTYVIRYSNPTGILQAGLDVTFFSYNMASTGTVRVSQDFDIVFIPRSVALVIYIIH